MNPVNTVNIVDFKLKSPTLAKVIISFTGKIDSEFLRETLARKLGHSAAVVAASFKEVRAGVAVGFIRANQAVRVLDGNEEKLTAKYRVMSSNILMDKSDQSLWDMKVGASGKYLTCRAQEDLSELVAATVQRRSDVPRLAHIAIAKAAQSELVAYVDENGDMDHGFAIATNEDQVRVLSYARRIPVTVDYDSVVSIYPVDVPKTIQREVSASLTADQKKVAKDYYTRLYGYNPEYMNMVIQQINESAVA